MEHQLAAAMNQPGFEGRMLSLQADSEAYFGHLARAREFEKKAVASALSYGDPELAAAYEVTGALNEAEFGNAALARQPVTAALAHHTGQMVQTLAALTFALSGNAKHATQAATELNRQFPLDTILNNYWLPTIRATIELNLGNPAKAVELLQATSMYELGTPRTPTNAVLYPVYLRGAALLNAGQGRASRRLSSFRK